MSKGFVTKEVDALVAVRDMEKLRKRGFVAATDYVRKKVLAVFEVEGSKVSSQPIGLVTDRAHMMQVVKRSRTKYARSNTLVRVNDLMELKELCRRTGRTKATISGGWKKKPDFPKPITRFGGSDVWYWPDVQAWMQAHDLRVERKE